MRETPVRESPLISLTLASVGIGSSFCNPSRGPTSRRLIAAGSVMLPLSAGFGSRSRPTRKLGGNPGSEPPLALRPARRPAALRASAHRAQLGAERGYRVAHRLADPFGDEQAGVAQRARVLGRRRGADAELAGQLAGA